MGNKAYNQNIEDSAAQYDQVGSLELDKKNEKSQEVAQPKKSASATDIIHFEKWLSELGSRKGTDLHLSVGNVPVIRVDGSIAPLFEEEILTKERIERIAESLLSEKELEILQKDKHLVLSKTLKKVMRFRIHAFYSRAFLALSLHHLSSDSFPMDNLPNAKLLESVVSSSQGFFIVSGPFDSGKTSTIKTLLSKINSSQQKYIATLERPVEYLIPSNKSQVAQREVGSDIHSFSEGLLSLKEEDIDVLFISEIENDQVLDSVLEMASSGRLVLATLPFKNTSAVLEYLRDLSSAEDRQRTLNLLADSLLGITTQIILPKIGGGRVMIASSMTANNAIKSLIRDGKISQITNIMQTSREEGMITLDRALADAVKRGFIDLSQAKEYTIDLNQFNMFLSR